MMLYTTLVFYDVVHIGIGGWKQFSALMGLSSFFGFVGTVGITTANNGEIKHQLFVGAGLIV